MTITVNGPNGVVVRFPDGTDAATINEVMQRAITQQQQPNAAALQAPPAQPTSPGSDKSWSGSILPFSSGPNGKVQFDPNAGLLGAAINVGKSAVSGATLPGDVYSGKVNPNSDEAIGRAAGLAAFASPVNPGVRIGEAAIPGAGKWFRRAPTAQELKATAGTQFDRARDMGVAYTPESVVRTAATAQQMLEQDGMVAVVAPKTHSILSDLQKPPADPTAQAPYTGVDAARKALGKVAQDISNPTDQLAARRAIDALDKFVAQPNPADVVAGPAAAVGEIATDARGNYAAASRASSIDAIGKQAADRASAANSGLNLDNSVRQRVASFIAPPVSGGPSIAKRSGFTESEIALLQNIVDGKSTTNTLRWLGNVLGGGGGLGAIATGAVGGVAGASVGNPVAGAILGVAAPAVGLGSKLAENAITRRSLAKMSETTRQRSPLYGDKSVNMTTTPNPAQRAAMIRALLMSDLPIASQPYQTPTQLRSTTGQPIPAGTTIY